MIKSPTRAALLLAMLFLSILSSAQPTFLAKYGRVSPAELNLTTYEPEPNAPAVVLFDKGRFNSIEGSFTRHMRIKILSTAGLSWANFIVRTPSESSIDGITYNLVNGEVEETKVKGENIFKERVIGQYYQFKVFFPNVKAGSVLDLKYSFSGIPFTWWFQDRIPVMYSEVILEPHTFVKYQKQLYGNVPVKQIDDFTWAAEKVPSLGTEPFMNHFSNYVTRFVINLRSITLPGFHMNVAETWGGVTKMLWDANSFGAVLKGCAFLNEKGRELKNAPLTKIAKIDSAFRFIQDNIKWNGVNSAFVTEDWIKNFTRNHSGNSAEVNLFLTVLLQKAGIKAYPMILSTRDNGLLNPTATSLNGFNYVAVYIKDENIEMMLDATEKDAIPGILPERCLNINGFVLDKLDGWWVEITPDKTNSRKQFIQLTLNPDGSLTADASNTYEDYDYLRWIEKYRQHGSEEAYIKALTATTNDLEITSCKLTVDGTKLRGVEKISADLTNSDHIHDLGNEVIINPFIFNDIVNPFKSETRSYPIDFIAVQKRSIIISIKIPENYEVQKVPDDLHIKPETGGAKFSFQTTFSNNILSIKCTYNIERQVFTEPEYMALRHFFSAINKKLSDPLQFYKKT